jgi:hypothetical protein
MVVETAQLLSTAHRLLDGKMTVVERVTNGKTRRVKTWSLPDERDSVLYKSTHPNHPSAVWVRESNRHYNWLADHLDGLLKEYTHRYGKQHKTREIQWWLSSPPLNLKDNGWSDPPCAMPDQYKISDDAVTNYREYYAKGKATMHSWKNRQPPSWILDHI